MERGNDKWVVLSDDNRKSIKSFLGVLGLSPHYNCRLAETRTYCVASLSYVRVERVRVFRPRTSVVLFLELPLIRESNLLTEHQANQVVVVCHNSGQKWVVRDCQ